MIRSRADNWSTARSLAFLAATFAIVFGALMPFAALAATGPGRSIVICSAEGPQTVRTAGDRQSDDRAMTGGHCAACVVPMAADLPAPPVMQPVGKPSVTPAQTFAPESAAPPPPARAPPRPPSTAPPHA